MALTPKELTDLSIKEVKDYFNSKGKVWTLHNFNISYYIMLCGAPCEVITFCDGRVENPTRMKYIITYGDCEVTLDIWRDPEQNIISEIYREVKPLNN